MLAVHFFELGFVVPGIDLTGSAVDEEPDDGLGFAIGVTFLGGEGIVAAGNEEAFVSQKAGESESAEACSGFLKPMTSGVM